MECKVTKAQQVAQAWTAKLRRPLSSALELINMEDIFEIVMTAIIFPLLLWIGISFGGPAIITLARAIKGDDEWWAKLLLFWGGILWLGASISFIIGPIVNLGINGLIGIVIGSIGLYLFLRENKQNQKL
ncbi:MAG: hypothetical protein OEZ58_21195 [Gammaproteobacteria bacterium]|nr:hypothetical protein [Gammaproteobacteria bacterium]